MSEIGLPAILLVLETISYLPKSMSRVANLALSLPMTRSQTDVQAIVSTADDPAETFCRFYSRSSDVSVVSLDSWLSWK